MLKTLILAVALVSTLTFACGDDDGPTVEDGSPTATSTARTGTAGNRTPTAAQLLELTKLAVPGYTSSEAGATLTGAGVTYTANRPTAGGAELHVRVLLAPCDPFVCTGLDPKQYESPDAQRNLKSVLPSAHLENPALRWDFGPVQLSSSATGLHYYALSYIESKGADGSVSRSSVNSYRAWYHNGGTYITLEVFGRRANADLSLSDAETRMTKAEAEQAAKDVFAVLGPKLPTK